MNSHELLEIAKAIVIGILAVLLLIANRKNAALKKENAAFQSKLDNTKAIIDERLAIADKYSRALATVADKTFEAVIITDKDGFIEWVNAGFTNITGYSFEEVRGKKPGAVLQGNETDRNTVDRIRTKLKDKKIFKEEIINYSKDGKKYWLSLSITPVLDKDGNVEKFIAIESDITESKKQKEELEKQLRDLLKK